MLQTRFGARTSESGARTSELGARTSELWALLFVSGVLLSEAGACTLGFGGRL